MSLITKNLLTQFNPLISYATHCMVHSTHSGFKSRPQTGVYAQFCTLVDEATGETTFAAAPLPWLTYHFSLNITGPCNFCTRLCGDPVGGGGGGPISPDTVKASSGRIRFYAAMFSRESNAQSSLTLYQHKAMTIHEL